MKCVLKATQGTEGRKPSLRIFSRMFPDLLQPNRAQTRNTITQMAHYTTAKLKPARFFIVKDDENCPCLSSCMVCIHLACVLVHVKSIAFTIKYSSRINNLRSLVKTATTETASRAMSMHNPTSRKIGPRDLC